MQSSFLRWGTVSAFVAVALGAFGAHGLKNLVSPEMLDVYKTGVAYQMWHALALIAIALIEHQTGTTTLLTRAGWLMLSGIILFSGSLYLLVLLKLKWLGMITPLGGVAFLCGWLCLILNTNEKSAQK